MSCPSASPALSVPTQVHSSRVMVNSQPEEGIFLTFVDFMMQILHPRPLLSPPHTHTHQIWSHHSHFLETEPSALASSCQQPMHSIVLAPQGESSRCSAAQAFHCPQGESGRCSSLHRILNVKSLEKELLKPGDNLISRTFSSTTPTSSQKHSILAELKHIPVILTVQRLRTEDLGLVASPSYRAKLCCLLFFTLTLASHPGRGTLS